MTNAAGAISIRVASDNDRSIWDSFLNSHGGGWPLADFRWSTILRESLGAQPVFLIAHDDADVIHGILPLYAAHQSGGARLYSLNRGLIARTPATTALLVDEAVELAKQLNVRSIDLSLSTRPDRADLVAREKAAIQLPLAENVEDAWAALRAKTRNMIRRADRVGITTESGNHNLAAFYQVYCRRMLELHVPIYGFTLIERALRTFSDRAELTVAKLNGAVVAGILAFFGSISAVYPLQATLTAHMDTAATQKLIWEVATQAIRRGIQTLDMGESRVGSPVYMSKVNFGGYPVPVFDGHLGLGAPRSTLLPSVLSRLGRAALAAPWLPIQRPAGLWLGRQGRLLL